MTSIGGQEHFFLYATPHRLVEFEQVLTALPRAELSRSVSSMPLPASAIGVLRGVGGSAPARVHRPVRPGLNLRRAAVTR